MFVARLIVNICDNTSYHLNLWIGWGGGSVYMWRMWTAAAVAVAVEYDCKYGECGVRRMCER